ncbi:hypothetical protein [Snodgrassella communis]|uniref:hypothetical protein n=1 Tax=Snodgrassella communis TaxID=2946699 RepID=UPI00286D1B2E|nr:hypothetical protein [Snodgrassella communis]WMY91433.1 hypothetical protein PYG29_08340 [Snodgrassella communis]
MNQANIFCQLQTGKRSDDSICDQYYNVTGCLYPLTIEDNVFDEVLAILETALRLAQ